MLSPALTDRVVVFAGPSLPPAKRPDRPSLVWRAPARAGDGLLLAAELPAAVVLLDGVFDEAPSIRHKELLMLVGKGVRVIGAASMGALRAAELHPFGVEGSGRIFRAFASGRLTGDDEVAVMHGPAELDWRPLSEPLVNVRATLLKARWRHVVTPAQARALLEAAQGLFYRERTWSAVIDRASARPDLADFDGAAFAAWLEAEAVDLKLLDAIEALQTALSTVEAPSSPRQMPPATSFTRALEGQVLARTALA